MFYTGYCKIRVIDRAPPVAVDDKFDTRPRGLPPEFYQDLEQIAKRREKVLAEIQRTPIKTQSHFGAAAARGMDILLSVIGILISLIPSLVIAMVIKISSVGPVFYRQTRVGKNGRRFRIIKFRTMVIDAEQRTGPVWASDNDPRQTRVGAFLRATKLDELPQLLNILLGSMTFVGPRPERPEFVDAFVKYIPAFNRRHDVKPGLTGLAQLRNGYDKQAVSVYRKLRWDVQYMRKKCLITDLVILYRTVVAVFSGGASLSTWEMVRIL